MSYVINRDQTNDKGESLDCQTNCIRLSAQKISESYRDFEYFERTGTIQVWIDVNRERALRILDRLNSIENEFITRYED